MKNKGKRSFQCQSLDIVVYGILRAD